MTKWFLPFIELNGIYRMKKIILFVVLVFLVALAAKSFYFYQSILAPLKTVQQQAVDFAQEQYNIQAVISIDFFHGETAYHVIRATIEGEEKIIWISEDFDQTTIRNASEGITEGQVREIVETELKPEKIVSIKLGMENEIPLYEVVYVDQQNQYSFYYLTFKNGRFLKHFQLEK